MELEACDGVLGSSEDDCIVDYIVAALLEEPSPPGSVSLFLSPDSVLDAFVPVGDSKGLEDVPGPIEIVGAETVGSTSGGESKEGEDVPGGESEEGEDVPGGESKEGNEALANRKANVNAKLKAKVKTRVKTKKNTFKCIVCEKTFGSGQALGGHMNAHPREKFKKIEEAYMKIHVDDSWAQDRAPDPQQSSWFQAPPNEINLVPGPANYMLNPCCDPTLQAIFQQAAPDQVYREQSNSMMPSRAQYLTTPSWNAQGSSSQPYSGSNAVPCSGPCCNPANYQQPVQYQDWSQSNSMMAPKPQDLMTSIWNAPSTSQPYLGYNGGPYTRPCCDPYTGPCCDPYTGPCCDPALQVDYEQTEQSQDWSHEDWSHEDWSHEDWSHEDWSHDAPDAQSSYQDPDSQSFYQDSDSQSFYQDPNHQSFYQDPNHQSFYQDPNHQSFYQDPNHQSFYQDPNTLNFYYDPNAQISSEDPVVENQF